jgi:hypothetical protein
MNPRDAWLASLANPHTTEYYSEIFDGWWDLACSNKHYLPPRSDDPFVWLRQQRFAELKSEATRTHCESVVREWCDSIKDSGAEPASVVTMRHVVSSFFHHAFLRSRGHLRLPRSGVS